MNQVNGLFDANIAGQVLLLDPNAANGFINHGLLRAIQALDGSQVQLTAGANITGGTLQTAGSGSIVNLDTLLLPR